MHSLRDDDFRGIACLSKEGDCFPPCVSYYFAIFILVACMLISFENLMQSVPKPVKLRR